MEMTNDRRKALAELVRKSSPTGNAVHVPAVMGEDEAERKKKRRRQLAKMLAGVGEEDYTLTLAKRMAIAKADDAGQYVGRLLVNADLLAVWWAGVRHWSEPEAIDPNPHLTVAYSSADFPWMIDRSWIFIPPEQIKGVGLLGPKNALVLFLDSPILESRWAATVEAGASWDYDGYKPHITVCYLGAGYDSTTWRDTNGAKVKLPDFPLVFGPELSSPRGVDVFEAVKAPSWYQDHKGVQS